MAEMIGSGAFTTLGIDSIKKPKTNDSDGPSGFTNFMAMANATIYDTCSYAAETVLGASWNLDLAYEMGKMIGNEGLICNERGDKLPYSGCYAPAVNIHRNAFAGRNWEYYSEDGLFSGKFAAQVIQGAKTKGVYTYLKHFAVNEQETNRDSNGLVTWLNEQALREIYLKPFEIAVKVGKTTAMMSSFNRIGTTWTGGDYNLLTKILRNEWGFKGTVITDYSLSKYLNAEQMIRAGGDLALTQGGKIPDYENLDATQLSCLRNATKNILYTVCNSNAMNMNIVCMRMPTWVMIMIGVDVGCLLAFAGWGVYVILKEVKKDKTLEKTKE
jgi:beta-glucosidase